jgi:monoamine oxidase
MGVEYGTSISRLGQFETATDWGQYEDTGLWGWWDSNVLDSLTELYFQPILDRIIYDSPIVRIEYDGARPAAIDAAGQRYEAEAIVVTVSVGVLKSEMIDFVPDLPAAKVAAYTTIGMDHCMKVIVRFDRAFWGTKTFGLYQNGHTNTCWAQGLVRNNATNDTLVCMITGENAEFMDSLGSDDAIVRQVLSDLDDMFGGTTASDAFEAAHVQNWGTEPYVRGCYSYPAPGTYPAGGGTSMGEVLAQPVANRVFFGGEAISRHHKATIQGALEGGKRAADEVDAVLRAAASRR